MTSLAAIAKALPGVDEGVACAGTAIESRTYRVGGKAFLFVGKKDVRLKLGTSAAEAMKRGCEVGAGGWTKLSANGLPPPAVLKRWIAESHALLGAPKKSARR